MNFASINDSLQQWTLENYVSTAASYPHCPSWVLQGWDRNIPRAQVDFKTAMNFITAAVKKDIATCHPRDIVQEQLKVSPIMIGRGGLVVLESKESVAVTTGFFLPDARRDDALSGWVSEAVAYQCTPPAVAPVGAVGVRVTEKDQDCLHLAQQTFENTTVTCLTSDPAINAHKLYDTFSVSLKDCHFNTDLLASAAQMSSKWIKRGLIAVTSIDSVLTKYVENVGGVNHVPVPVMNFQNNLVVTNESFYNVLQQHTAVRYYGDMSMRDLTTGYYLGAMSCELDSVLWQVIDIMSVVSLANLDTVLFNQREFDPNVAAVLASNGLTVLVNSPSKRKLRIVRFIDLSVVTPPESCVYYSKSVFPDTSPFDLTGVDYHEKNFDLLFQRFVADHCWRMTHVYLRDYHKGYTSYILPSVHCHVGHVILVNRPALLSPIDIKVQFSRMTLANKYKTSFPVLRVPFSFVDPYCPSVVLDGFKVPSNCGNFYHNCCAYTDKDVRRILDALVYDVDLPSFKFCQFVSVVFQKVAFAPKFICHKFDPFDDFPIGGGVVEDCVDH
jgi:hypothetical protein